MTYHVSNLSNIHNTKTSTQCNLRSCCVLISVPRGDKNTDLDSEYK